MSNLLNEPIKALNGWPKANKSVQLRALRALATAVRNTRGL